MITFIFDSNLSTEKSIQFSSFNEIIGPNRLNASREIQMESTSDIPDLSDFNGYTHFSTLSVINGDNIELPLSGEYNKISSLTVSYFDSDKSYQINISLTYEE